MTQLATQNDAIGRRLEEVMVLGNLSALTPVERTEYYRRLCNTLGLEPLTQPLTYLTLNGKLVLYANRAAAEQLRKVHGVSISPPLIEYQDDLVLVTVTASDATGRQDSDMGVVALGRLTGEARANAILKAVTKAKRRVTLSICGLGMLDETEIEDIPASAKRPAEVQMPQARVSMDGSTGEIKAPKRKSETVEAPEQPQRTDDTVDGELVAAPVPADTIENFGQLWNALPDMLAELGKSLGDVGMMLNVEPSPAGLKKWYESHQTDPLGAMRAVLGGEA